MVLEKLYHSKYILEHKPIAFVLGIAYAICGISFALFLFPEDPAPISIAFISLFSVVSLSDLLIFREESRIKAMSIKHFVRENEDILVVLMYMFLGILVTFAFFAIFMPGMTTNQLFANQADLIHTFSAKEIFTYGDFYSIFANNSKVLFVCIASALFFGISTIFLFIIIWNASVIGVVFGLAAKHSAINQNPFTYFLLILLAALPHIILEISAYFFGGLVGDKLSYILAGKNILSKKHQGLLTGAVFFLIMSFFLLVLAAVVETVLTPNLINLFL